MSKYKVSLYVCPGSFPLWFAKHPWFEIDKNGQVDRWGVSHIDRKTNSNWGHLYLNFLPATKGLGIFYLTWPPFWNPTLIGSVEGDVGSLAHKLSDFIDNSRNDYPYRDRYSFTGPNSNTYAQWVLNQFPEWKIKLPWNAFGKNYHG